MHKILRSY